MKYSLFEPIRLGLMPPLTGLVGMYGSEIVWAARIACEEINEQSGLLGRHLELIIEDDGSFPSTAVPSARRLVEHHHCSAIIGNLLSNSRIAIAAQVAEPSQIPYLNFSFYEGSIACRYFFHFSALPNQQIERMIPYMAHRYGVKMFFAGNNYEWPRGSIDAAKRSLQALEGTVVGEEYLSIGVGREEIDDLLERVARSGADVFVPYFAGLDQLALLTRFTEMGLKRRMAVVMGHYDEVMASHLPPEVREGFYSSSTYFMSIDTPENQRYLDRLKRQPEVEGLWPEGNGVVTNFGEGTYLCVHAFAQAVKQAGSTESEVLVDALEHVQVIGPQGMVTMDPETHHASVNSYLSRCNADGSFTIIERFGSIAPVIPERYQEQMRTVHLHESPASPQSTARLAAETSEVMPRIGAAQQILRHADTAIIATDLNGLITEANPGACYLFGYTQDELLGLSVHLLLPPHYRQRHVELLRRFVESEETERRMGGQNEVVGYRKDGTFFPMQASIAKFRDGNDWALVATMRDITELRKAEEEMTWRATHDVLTGLPNRALIRDRLANALERSRRQELSSVALLFVDLDGFKLINDTHGHEIGDQLLRTIATRLVEQVRPGDTVARLGGDEFVVLCENLEHSSSILAERINDAIRQPIDCGGSLLFVSSSIGIAVGHGTTHSPDDLLRCADTAMYAVKERGRDGWQLFSESLQEKAHQRLVITQGLRLAIENREFSCRFQPIVAPEDGRIVGTELLLRWHTPEGDISPAIFIPIAEMTGMIVPIGTWVFREACRAEVNWRLRWGNAAPYVSVNLSTRQLSEDDLVTTFAAILRETGAEPTRLLLEVTETALMADIETNLRVLRLLAHLGLGVAVDDFGTGYSSLSQLTRLPVNILKIDRMFIDGIENSPQHLAVVRAIIGLARALDLKIIAEGVEREAQLRELRANGCDLVQGYLFHRPLEENVLAEILDRAIVERR
jgi:diguanylate cyclase (GGDEF)-like protein/PAS domain S-box-containing protein